MSESSASAAQGSAPDRVEPISRAAADSGAADPPPPETADAPIDGSQGESNPENGSGSPAGARRRRRGRRGGRNRRRPAGGGASGSASADDLDDGIDDVEGGRRIESIDEPDDETDARADRGLTSDDVAASAAEDAGLRSRPKIGDTRPAPPGQTAQSAQSASGATPEGEVGGTKRRRRRRGGRGRGTGTGSGSGAAGGGGGGGGGGRDGGQRPTFVDGALSVGDVDVDGTAILDALDDKTRERRQGSTRKGRPAGRYLMVVHVHADGISQLSVLEGRNLVEHYVSRPLDDETLIDGNIYLGRVQNVLPGMEAAFVDIGTKKNAVLYRADVAYDTSDFEGERPRIERVLNNGQSVMVQVTKNPIAHKGARLTQEVSLAGRFVVMVPGQPKTYGISKRLPDDERKRLRRVLDRLRPADSGLIVRTAAEGATEDELARDLNRLQEQWRQIEELAKRSRPGSLLYREPPLVVRVIREEFTKEYRGVVIDDQKLFEEVRAYVGAVSPELAARVEHYDPVAENLPIFEQFHVIEQLHKALDRKVWLPSGGSLVIEPTEALTVIDVNTGKNVGRSNLEDTVFQNNLEASEVVARELRLRDIGGIIVIDFIDMESEGNRRKVEDAFRAALARDKTRTQVYPISELGLLQMTRKRIGEGMNEALSHPCESCRGHGFVIDESLLPG